MTISIAANFFSNRVENVGKGENSGSLHVLIFPYFQMAFSTGLLNGGNVRYWVLSQVVNPPSPV